MKTVFITGANRGLGLEFSRQYLAAGNRVIATARNPEDSEGLQALKKEYGEHLSLYPLDVTDANSRAAVSDAVGDRVIHLLINNAGYYGANNPLGKLDEADWSKVFHVNCIGPV
ncbi:MAG TPA: short-chain dehydrogenase, partial [Gammaproteobacteria bacterium]|nr:short-chain dehydrogenase [Gammaproteobacteria bacterium]